MAEHYRKMPYPELIKEHEDLVKACGTAHGKEIQKICKRQKKELKIYKQDYRRLK